MKLFYFSGTGNSLWTAKEIQKSNRGADLIPITKFNESVIDDDIIGFIFPCYCLNVPAFIRKFISGLTFTNENTYIFAVVTHNSVPGRTLYELDLILKKQGKRLNYGADLLMPGNSVILKDYTNPKEEVERRLNIAPSSLKKIIKDINSKKEKNSYAKIKFLKKVKTGFEEFILNQVYIPTPFWSDKNCNSCGTCTKVCPTGSIKIKKDQPKWSKGCVACLACFHWCPKSAIQMEKYTFDRPRLHHPEIKINEIILN